MSASSALQFFRERTELNATQAAIRAGYSAKTAEQQGPRLLGNVWLSAAISKAKQAQIETMSIAANAARVLSRRRQRGVSNATH